MASNGIHAASGALRIKLLHIRAQRYRRKVALRSQHGATDLLVEQGLSVGTYTSPHLERVHERISWNGAPIDDDALSIEAGVDRA